MHGIAHLQQGGVDHAVRAARAAALAVLAAAAPTALLLLVHQVHVLETEPCSCGGRGSGRGSGSGGVGAVALLGPAHEAGSGGAQCRQRLVHVVYVCMQG